MPTHEKSPNQPTNQPTDTIYICLSGSGVMSHAVEKVDSIVYVDPKKVITAHLTCPDDNHPHAIDLGLPSGTKWACCNVGASSPSEYGSYYSWGETEQKSEYTWATYIHSDGSATTCHDIGDDLAGTQYDAAHMLCGDAWSMPSIDQWKELNDSDCTWTWKEANKSAYGIAGYEVTATNGGVIFLPAAGFRNEKTKYVGDYGYYWLDRYALDGRASSIFLGGGYHYSNNFRYRYEGFSVRAVCK